MYELIVRDHIAAAHFLRGYVGKCQHLHGHTWKIEVRIGSQTLNDLHMVADFVDIKKQLKDLLDTLDHRCLNDLPFFQDVNPTTESLSRYIFEELKSRVLPLALKSVTVWESDLCGVTYGESSHR
jgi:6-pyruvoyltetrahydropterin/6-carboxytetrahydropterin synthase